MNKLQQLVGSDILKPLYSAGAGFLYGLGQGLGLGSWMKGCVSV